MSLSKVYLVVEVNRWGSGYPDCKTNSVALSGSINDQKTLTSVEARGFPESPKLLYLFSPEEKKETGREKKISEKENKLYHSKQWFQGLAAQPFLNSITFKKV